MFGLNKWWFLAGGLLLLAILGLGVALVGWAEFAPAEPTDPAADIDRQVHTLCASCHLFPPPDSFPKADWKREVEQGYEFAFRAGRQPRTLPPFDDVLAYFEARAPERLPAPAIHYATKPCPVHFDPLRDGAAPQAFGISNLSLVRLWGRPGPVVLACDMQQNVVKVLRLDDPKMRWEVVAHASEPAHAEVVDLDQDGVPDILVACLGSLKPTDKRCGSVLWLR